jgi:rhamnogalacturonan hydrolase
MLSQTLLGAIALLPALTVAQLSGPVGPSTDTASKAATKTCDVTDYGAVADKKTDIGPPLASAWAACKTGGLVVVPEGDYAISTWATLTGGSAVAIQLDGVIYRTGKDSGNMIFIEHTDDFELFSSTGGGAVQGNGYEIHAEGSSSGARILRLYEVTNFSVHDLVLVDAPAFHFSMGKSHGTDSYSEASC